MLSNVILEANNVYHIYRGRAQHASVVALKGVSLKLREGEFVAVVGPSGSGKSTLLQILGGLMRPTAGSVIFNQLFDLTKTAEEDLTIFRRNEVGYVFQEGNLLPDLSAFDNVAQSLMLNGVPYEFRKKRTLELLELMGVLHRKDQLATRLSGGERQRVAIARAMANNPKIILADEPTGNVDFKTSVRLLELFKQLNQDFGLTLLFATHSNHVAGYADRSLELRDGLLLGQHGKDIDLSQLDLSRMVVLDSDDRITLPEEVKKKMGSNYGVLWRVDVVDSKKVELIPVELLFSDEKKEKEDEKRLSIGLKECPVCGAENPIDGKFCISCGAKL
ncbi:MAG: ATP-binding cassette domain-containing protein [Candidatus Hodarchaeales archaeon]